MILSARLSLMCADPRPGRDRGIYRHAVTGMNVDQSSTQPLAPLAALVLTPLRRPKSTDGYVQNPIGTGRCVP